MSAQTQQQVVVASPAKKSLVTKFADKFHVEPNKLMGILKATAFKKRSQNDPDITEEQLAALLIVADQYGLNPFTKEIYAVPDKQNGIVPVVGVDGWARIINEHPQLDGVEFGYADKQVKMVGSHVEAPEWCEVIIHRKDRSKPTIVREYLDEVYREPFSGKDRQTGKAYVKDGPWQTHTKRFLRHKTLIQGARIAFGFAGIFDQDEAERIVEAQQEVVVGEGSTETKAPSKKGKGVSAVKEKLGLTQQVVGEQLPTTAVEAGEKVTIEGQDA